MRNELIGAAGRLVMAASLGASLLASTSSLASETQEGRADLVARVLPSVVTIFTRSADGTDKNATLNPVRGSGFVIDPDGLIVTNRHVVEGARQLIVGFSDGSRALGTVVAAGQKIDLALVKVSTDHKLPALSLGDSDQLRVGDPVLAMGNPLGIGTSVSSGIVSALHRDIKDTVYDDYIQTDAAMNHGNSGGPLIDAQGHVIGMDSDIFSSAPNGGSIGLGFALTSNVIKFIVDRLVHYGRVKAGWIGADLQDITPPLAASFGQPGLHGTLVTSVTPQSPAAEAGLVEGDVVQRINDVAPHDAREAMRDIAFIPVGDPVRLTVWRNGTPVVVSMSAAEIPGADLPSNPAPLLNNTVSAELRLSVVTDQTRNTYGLPPGQNGVLVTAVPNDAFTGQQTLLPGDLILRVQQAAVTTPDDVHHAFAQAATQGHALVPLLVRTREGVTWMPLRVGGADAP